MSHNLYTHFHNAFASHLAEVAIETDDARRWTFGDLHAQSAQMANWLQSQGLKPGDRVMV
jgi:malonyl-CoA/methylmalonyl-CoA synthetase